MSYYIKKRATHKKLKIFLIVISVIIAIGLVGGTIFYKQAKDLVAELFMQELSTSDDSSDTSYSSLISDSEASDLYNSMSDDDKAVVNDIIENHISVSTISDVTSYLTDNDMDGLKDYAYDILSSEEIQTLETLYEKYSE